MQGDERRRYCRECERQVHDLGQMTPREIAALIEASRGHLCARITRDRHGRIVTLDPGPPPAAANPGPWRASPVAAAVVSGFLGLGTAAAAGPAPPPAASTAPGSPEQGAKPEGARPQRPTAKGAGLRGRIADEATGAPLPGVQVVARNAFDGRQHSATTAADGEFTFDGLGAGVYDLEAWVEGFAVAPQSDILLNPGERREIGMQALAMGEESEEVVLAGVMAVAQEPLRRMFEDSELVVLATADSSIVIEQNEGFGEVATDFVVGTTLKGRAPGRSIRVHHAEVEAEEQGRFAPGTKVLAFLRTRDDGSSRRVVYESADYHFGLKALPAAELAAYGERLSALARLLRRGAPHPADLVEWLVATLEEPLTRHEATGELSNALWSLGELAERRGTSTEHTAEDLQAVVTRFLAEGGSFESEPAPALLAAFLTGEQKERLSEAFEAAPRLTEAELSLFAIIRPWAGDQALSWLVRKFQTAEAPGLDRGVMSIIAEELEDEELRGLLAAAGEEIHEYASSLADESTDDVPGLIDQNTKAVEKELRRRFAQALGARP
ncbi:MAG TPA: carboxypeptidase-like regulatory domain-containing protein [Thermoanaerobaculia bacterium]|nr:carboxypeptidase-like regulatory domain-containing protein [Thermoanaerobaculia bacterium]